MKCKCANVYEISFSLNIRIGFLLRRNVRCNRNRDLVLFVEEAEIISALIDSEPWAGNKTESLRGI